MNGQSVRVHRLGVHEVERYVRKAQTFSPGLEKRFRNYGQWLERLLKELKQGSRVAFGAFLDTQGESDGFLGSVLLKRGPAGLVEAKNMLVRPPPAGRSGEPSYPTPEEIQRCLLQRVESFSRRRGLSQIDVELFVYEQDLNSAQTAPAFHVLLGNGYALQSIRPSTYHQSDSFYTFSKMLPAVFSGDPTDEVLLSRWLVHDFFGFQHVEGPLTVNLPQHAVCHCYRFEIPYQPGRNKNDAGELRIRGCCVVDFGNGELASHVRLARGGSAAQQVRHGPMRQAFVDANVRVLISFRDIPNPDDSFREIPDLDEQGREIKTQSRPALWCLDSRRIESLVEPEVARQPRGKKIGGLVLELPKQQIKSLLEGHQPFGYYVVNGIGAHIYFESQEHYPTTGVAGPGRERAKSEYYALLAALDRDAHGHRGAVVWGLAGIESIEPYSPRTAFFGLEESRRLWDLTHYDYYVNDFTTHFDDEDSVFVLKLGPPVQFATHLEAQKAIGNPSPGNPFALGVTTQYVSMQAIKKLRSAHPEAFEEANRLLRDWSAVGSPPPENKVPFLAEIVKEVDLAHDGAWFSGLTTQGVSNLARALSEALRASYSRPESEKDDARGARSADGPPERGTPPESRPDSNERWGRIRQARYDLRKARNSDEKVTLAWVLRLEGRKLLDELRALIPPREKRKLEACFPTAEELQQRMKDTLVNMFVRLFPHPDAADAFVTSRLSAIARKPPSDTRDFHALVEAVFAAHDDQAKQLVGDLLAIDSLPADARGTLRDMLGAISAFRRRAVVSANLSRESLQELANRLSPFLSVLFPEQGGAAASVAARQRVFDEVVTGPLSRELEAVFRIPDQKEFLDRLTEEIGSRFGAGPLIQLSEAALTRTPADSLSELRRIQEQIEAQAGNPDNRRKSRVPHTAYPKWNPALTSLITLLMNYYADSDQARLVARKAGLDPDEIDFSGVPKVFWMRVVEEANRRDKVSELTNVLRADYPNADLTAVSGLLRPPPAPVSPERRGEAQ